MMNKITIQLISAAAALAISAPVIASAQPEVHAQAQPTTRLDVQAAVAVPIGDASNILDPGFGALVAYSKMMTPQLSITGRTGLIYQTGEGSINLLHIPIMGGAEMALAPRGSSYPYVFGELGLVYLHGSVDTGFGRVSDSEIELGLSAGAGYRLGGLDLRAQLYIPSLDEADDTMHMMANAGWTFRAL